MAPAQVAELYRAWERREARMDLRFGTLMALIANMFGSARGFPVGPWDFFPNLEHLRPPPPTDEELEAKIVSVFGSMQGG